MRFLGKSPHAQSRRRLFGSLGTLACLLIGASPLAAQTITVGSAAGAPGSSVWFAVILTPGDEASIAATQNDITFNSINTPIRACEKSSELDKDMAINLLLPSGCSGLGCNRVRVIVHSQLTATTPPTAILNDTVLYRCRVDIPSSAADGAYALQISAVSGSDPLDNAVAITGADGQISVSSGSCSVAPQGAPRSLLPPHFVAAVVIALLRRCARQRSGSKRPRPRFGRSQARGVNPWAVLVAVPVLIVVMPLRHTSAQTCVGDCDGNGEVWVTELTTATNIALGSAPVSACLAADRNGDQAVTVDELDAAITKAQEGCPPPPALIAGVGGIIRIHNPAGIHARFRLSGQLKQRTMPGGTTLLRSSYIAACPPNGACICDDVECTFPIRDAVPLSPGVWRHRIFPARPPNNTTTQRQATQDLYLQDPVTQNVVEWTIFPTVLTVTTTGDSGSGACPDGSGHCALRDAIAAANAASARPVLIQFQSTLIGRVFLSPTNPAPLAINAPDVAIDGTTFTGDPSPINGFESRSYERGIETSKEYVQAHAGALEINSQNVEVTGVHIHRELNANDDNLIGIDQPVVAFGSNSRNSRIRNCRIDGGAAQKQNSDCPQGQSCPATGKDCVDADSAATTSFPTNPDGSGGDANVVDNTELTLCYDRAAKSSSGHLIVKNSWAHNNLRGGLFANGGHLRAERNLIEHNGKNCPFVGQDAPKGAFDPEACHDSASAPFAIQPLNATGRGLGTGAATQAPIAMTSSCTDAFQSS